MMSSGRVLISWRARADFSIAQARKARSPPFVQLATVDSSQVAHGGKPLPKCRTVVFRGFLEGPDANQSTLCSQPLKIITDRRSEKVPQILANSSVELIYWFPGSNEQFRISGRAELHAFHSDNFNTWVQKECPSADGAVKSDLRYKDAVVDQWKQLKDQAREQFYWNAPGVNFNGLDYSKERKYDFEKDPKRRHTDGTEAIDGSVAEPDSVDAVCSEAPEKNGLNSGGKTHIPAGGRDAEAGEILDPPDTFLLLLVHPQEVKYLRLGDNFATLDSLDISTGSWRAERVNP